MMVLLFEARLNLFMNQAVDSLQFVNKGLVHMQAKDGQVSYNKLEFCFVVNYSGIQTACSLPTEKGNGL